MGVDSGLPDFRGQRVLEGPTQPTKLGVRFEEMANRWFERDPEFAWGFTVTVAIVSRHRPSYRFSTMFRTGEWPSYLGVTSNVDGQFSGGFLQAVGRYMVRFIAQCRRPCHSGIWSAKSVGVELETGVSRCVQNCPVVHAVRMWPPKHTHVWRWGIY